MFELKMGYVGAVWPVDAFQHVTLKYCSGDFMS